MIIKTLEKYRTISLDEMASVRLMNRVDTKFVTTKNILGKLLESAIGDYRVQMIGNVCILPYSTLYFDTDICSMYLEHLHGHKKRQKIRIRSYVSSGLSFLEIKDKNNKGRTSKKRIQCQMFSDDKCLDFITNFSRYDYLDLQQQVENKFDRITLVNNQMTERVTIDSNLKFHNFKTDECCHMKDLVIIEVKTNSPKNSQLLKLLRELRVFPSSFSKYCIGMSMTNPDIKHNRFKPILLKLKKHNQIVHWKI